VELDVKTELVGIENARIPKKYILFARSGLSDFPAGAEMLFSRYCFWNGRRITFTQIKPAVN